MAQSIITIDAHNIDTVFAYVRSLYFFEGIEDEYIRSFLSHATLEGYSPDTTILREGEPSDGRAYIILDGTVEVMIEGKLVGTVGEGMIFGEYALISEEARTATVKTRTEITALIIDDATLLELVGMSDSINRTIMDRVKENIRNNYGVFKDI